MPSYRILPTNTLRRAVSKPSKAIMPCYVATPRHHYSGFGPFVNRAAVSPFGDVTATLQPFFRMLDAELSNAASAATSRPQRLHQPRFDVREEADAYHLQGELPGIDSKDVSIEFKDENTLAISGRTVRESQTGNQTDAAASDNVAAEATADTASETASTYKSPTVEDEFVDVGEGDATPSTEEKGKQVEKSASAAPAKSEPQHKYWVSERSVGEFHRTFTFPGHLNQDGVTASLKNGILNVVVPKAAQKEPRRINIE